MDCDSAGKMGGASSLRSRGAAAAGRGAALGKCGFLLALVCMAAALLLSGCTQSSFVPCCQKSSVYNYTNASLLASPVCILPDESTFGGCVQSEGDFKNGYLNCTPGAGYCNVNMDECAKRFGCKWSSSAGTCGPLECGSITGEAECNASMCTWSNILNIGACSGGVARKSVPVCVDDVPTSCINNRCKAMMCGFTNLQPAPPPSSQDWPESSADAASAMPVNGLTTLPAGNLLGTSCTITPMNKKLSNQVKQSHGSLWVNSFRFGVGSSFSDYDLSHNFFPQSDKLCSPSPSGTVDRYFNYLNLDYDSWCNEVHSIYRCSTTGMNFTDETVCARYCNEPSNCQVASGILYACPESKFAYANQSDCKKQCEAVGNPNQCTDNEADYPFLTDGARFKTKYTADYLVDTWSTYSFHETCQCKQGAGDGCEFGGWDPDCHSYCDDFYGTGGGSDWSLFGGSTCRSSTPSDGPWAWAETTQGTATDGGASKELTQYFDMRKFATLDLDTGYYATRLKLQYTKGSPDPYSGKLDTQLPFECGGSNDCYSGVCDYNDYSRFLAINNSGGLLEVGCKMLTDSTTRKTHLDCTGSYPNATYVMTAPASGRVEGVSRMFEPDQSVKGSDGKTTRHFIYFVIGDTSSPGSGFPLFERCGVQPIETNEKYCLYSYGNWAADLYDVLIKANATGGCNAKVDLPYRLRFKEKTIASKYDIDFSSTSSLGICQIEDNTKSPYIKMQKFGWCAPCTYSTLAVQKVDWLRDTPDAYGYVKAFACYEWRGDANYNYSLGARVKNDGSIGYQIRNASVSDARMGGVPREGTSPLDGSIEREGECGTFSCDGDIYYSCRDGWNSANSWWPKSSVPYPSAPYLYDKLTTYLRSNVMPVLDVRDSKTYGTKSKPSGLLRGGFWDTWTSYDPLQVCTKFGGRGAEIFVIGNVSLLTDTAFDQGVNFGDLPEVKGNIGDHVYSEPYGIGAPYSSLDGTGAILMRSQLLKDRCDKQPLVGLAIDESYSRDNDAARLIGTGNLSVYDSPGRGVLHKFFYAGRQSFEWNVRNGQPDNGVNVDLLMQEWYPKCNGGGSLMERIEREVGGRMEFSRALLGNLSKPSLVWKFHFPDDSQCNDDGTGAKHYNAFMDYLFNNTGNMVDSGMFGIIYDSWMTDSGKGYGQPGAPQSHGQEYTVAGGNYELKSGLSNSIAQGALDNPSLDSPLSGVYNNKVDSPFCEVQKNSRRVIGITKTSFGQKVNAGDGCNCIKCTDADYAMGTCDKKAAGISDQHYCNDGHYCTMPEGITDYANYHCSYTCANASRCELCANDAVSKSFCLIEPNGQQAEAITKNYSQITDDYWEWVAGLPAKNKCCLQSSVPDQPVQTYTYVARSGGKSRSEFLQYPARGEIGIDCGRIPDTSVLSYCGVKIPIATETFKCWKVG